MVSAAHKAEMFVLDNWSCLILHVSQRNVQRTYVVLNLNQWEIWNELFQFVNNVT